MITTQEKLNELTTEIRTSIPRLMELSEGCEIKIQYDVSFFITGKCFDTYYAVSENGWNFKTLDSIDIMETIGREPLLNDVLEWLKIKGIKISDTTDDLLLCFGGYKHYSFWDLSKLKLSDQSPELINFLHDLIPNK